MHYDWNFYRLLPYQQAFFSGIQASISLTIITIILGSFFGVILGILLRHPIISKIIYPLVDIVRALPPLVLILTLYYLLTKQIIGLTFHAYWVAVIALSLNLSAFTADLVRAGIDSVPPSSLDAGRALGMSQAQLTQHIILPYVIRSILPSMTLLYIGVLKMTSLASVINVREVVYTAQSIIADISRSLEAWVIVGGIYIVLVVPSTYAVRFLEKRINLGRAPNNF